MYEIAAHHDDSVVRASQFFRLCKLEGMTVMERIIFCDNTDGFHRKVFSCYSCGAGGGGQFSGGGPGKASVLSEKAVLRLLNLVPLQGFVERERASKEN